MSAPESKCLKILLVIRDLDIGGAQRQVIAIARAMRKRGHSVAILTFYGQGELENDLQCDGVDLINGSKRGRWDVWRPFRDLKQTITSFQPDCVYSFLALANIYVGLAKTLGICDRWIFGYRHSNMAVSEYSWLQAAMYGVEAWLSRQADTVIANSIAGAENAARWGFDPNRMCVIPNGIETAYYRPCSAARSEFRRRFGVMEETTLIGLVARIDPMKGHDLFLDAAASVARELPNVQFAFVGEGSLPLLNTLQEKAKSLGIMDEILWTGAQRDMKGVYNGLDIVCLPSLFGEGFPNVIGEAMACGTPCVASDVGDSRRIVADVGYIVPFNDAEKLAAELARAVRERHMFPVVRCRERIVQEYNTDCLGERTERAVRSAIKGSRDQRTPISI